MTDSSHQSKGVCLENAAMGDVTSEPQPGQDLASNNWGSLWEDTNTGFLALLGHTVDGY